jgi:hypothetical protein
MTTTVVKTIGTASRDYSTLQAWEDACPADLVAVDQIWQGQCYNDAEFTAGLSVAGTTTDATRYKELTTAAGQSFSDNANVQTNALRYNQANGVAISVAGGYSTGIAVTDINFRMSKVQVKVSSDQNCYDNNTASTAHVLDKVILQQSGSNGACVRLRGGYLSNSLLSKNSAGTSKAAITGAYGDATLTNCTIVRPTTYAVGGTAIVAGSGFAFTLKNVAVFGFTADTSGTISATTCYTDDSTPTTGFTTVAYNTSTGSGFQNTAVTTADFRIKTGSALLDVGTTDTTYAATDIAGTARPQGSAYDVGAWELVASAGGGDATATITGVSGSGQIGTLSTSGNASVSLTGASGTGSVGSVVASVSVATAITGVNGAGQVGNTTQTGAANVAVSTVAGTGQVGTVSASGIGAPDGNVAITGIAGTGQVGTLAASGNGAVSITGIAATGSVGSVTPSVTVTTTITGAIGTGSVGTTTQTGAANATVSSAVGIGLVGTVSATGTSQDGNAVISGISGIGSVGIVSANDGTVVNNHGFIIIDTEPRLWWKRKPSKLDDKKAEEKIFKVARVIERVVKHVANSNEPSVSKEVYRKAAYAEVAPLLREMPGFDWSPMFRAILTQSKLQEQNRIAAEQAGILAKQEIERIKRIRDDEEALIVLLMGA